jgi:cytochrome b subunit of formate dehydrogenase
MPPFLAGSVHEGFGCDTCHATAHELTAADDDACAGCHDAAPETLAQSVHAEVVQCQECHGDPHRIVPVAETDAPVSQVRQLKSCGGCHSGPELEAYLGSVHARAMLVKGLISAPSCSDCHGAHDIWPRDDERSTFSRHNVPTTCGTCHLYILETWREQSAHGTAWLAGEPSPVCTTCHESHKVVPPNVGDRRLKMPEDCGSCHDSRYTSYGHNFHGEATDLGMLAAATCSDCHTPHANLPAADPRSSVHPDNLRKTCGACHERVTDNVLAFEVHSEPSNFDGKTHPAVNWTWLLMTSLLIGVFIFFGIHDLLWLQRSIVALARGELSRVKHSPNEGTWVRRFRPGYMWLHVVVIVTFLTLAATGLPLKFHHTDWARGLATVFGGIEASRVLHRMAAILTFGYAIFHLVYLVRRVYVRRERTILWGWRSLVPQPRDLFDMLGHIRWFLYMGPQPKFGRWTYWEKFDYFAVFWGVAIIGFSGLMLWFPFFFMLFLPGWMLNVAFIIHSDEALLATSFIFVFHFFHSHMRPENFPLDPAMFVGAVPLERFKEERPMEYEKLVAEGRLDEFVVPAPGRVELHRAYWFGGIALTIGLLLAFGILLGLLTH